MAYTTAGLNSACDGVAAAGTRISFHTADPGTAGSSEIPTGGGYSRQATTWAAASNGARVGSQITATIPSNTTITHWGIWTAATGGSFLYGGALPTAETFGSGGTYAFTPTITATN